MKYFITVVLLFLLIFPIHPVGAEFTYTLGEQIPGGEREINSFAEYMRTGFVFFLSATIALAFVMTVYGGIEYAASAGSTDRISRARNKISGAILGIIIGATALLILRTINPQLETLNFEPPRVEVPGSPGGSQGGSPGGDNGGSPGGSNQPGLSDGRACTGNAQCTSGFCFSNVCLAVDLPNGETCSLSTQCRSQSCDLETHKCK